MPVRLSADDGRRVRPRRHPRPRAAGLRATRRAGRARGCGRASASLRRAPGRRGRDRRRQEPGLPRARARLRTAHRRRDGDQGAAGAAAPARRPGGGSRLRQARPGRAPERAAELPLPPPAAGIPAVARHGRQGRHDLRGDGGLARDDRDRRPRRARDRAVARAVGRARGRRRPLFGPALSLRGGLLRRGGSRPRRRGRARDRQPRALLRRCRGRRRASSRSTTPSCSTRRTGSRSRLPAGSAAASRAPACDGSCWTSSASRADAHSVPPQRQLERVVPDRRTVARGGGACERPPARAGDAGRAGARADRCARRAGVLAAGRRRGAGCAGAPRARAGRRGRGDARRRSAGARRVGGAGRARVGARRRRRGAVRAALGRRPDGDPRLRDARGR